MEQIIAPSDHSTIVAVSTAPGMGGIAVIRLSGADAFIIADKAWKGARLRDAVTHTAHLGQIIDEDGSALDQAVATVYRAPGTFTGEDTIEFSVHGSPWIQRNVVKRLVALGAVPATPGEFSMRAFLNGRMDLAQTEGVADLIAASSRAAHRLAMRQTNGAFSRQLDAMRETLTELASLLELELDFSEEDVEFADRQKLTELARETRQYAERLVSSYRAGKVFKEGVPVVIAGAPNVGKSTLLNTLLADDKAIVSDIPGTTRDVIEDTVELDGILFRFFDTAGIRFTSDEVEKIGIDRARKAIDTAAIVLWLIDPVQDLETQFDELKVQINAQMASKTMIVINKSDILPAEKLSEIERQVSQLEEYLSAELSGASNLSAETGDVIKELAGISKLSEKVGEGTEGLAGICRLSAKTGEGIKELEAILSKIAKGEYNPDTDIIVTNERHFQLLQAGAESLKRVEEGIEGMLPPDIIAQDTREALHHLGQLTGAITTDTLLATIFSRFCIGK